MSMASGNFFAADQQFSTSERTLGRSLWAKKNATQNSLADFHGYPPVSSNMVWKSKKNELNRGF